GKRGDGVTRLDVSRTGDLTAALAAVPTPGRGIVLVPDPASHAPGGPADLGDRAESGGPAESGAPDGSGNLAESGDPIEPGGLAESGELIESGNLARSAERAGSADLAGLGGQAESAGLVRLGDRTESADLAGPGDRAESGGPAESGDLARPGNPAKSADLAESADLAGLAEPAESDLLNAVALGRAMTELPRGAGRLWIVTSGAHHPAGEQVNPWHTAVWEAGRVLAVEIPDRWGGLIDVGADADAGTDPGSESAAKVAEVLAAEALDPEARDPGALSLADPDDQLRLSAGTWEAARLAREPDMAPSRDSVDAGRWHVVLGGPEAWPAVRSLVECGARRLLLAGDISASAPQPTDSAPRDGAPRDSAPRDSAPRESAPNGRASRDGVPSEWDSVEWEVCPPGLLGDRLGTIAPLGDVIAFAPPVATGPLASATEREITGPFRTSIALVRDLDVVGRHRPRRITVVTAAGPAWGSVNTIAAAGPAGLLAGWARRAAAAIPVSLLGLMPRDDTGELTDADRPLFSQSGLRPLTSQDTAALLRTSLLAQPGERTAALVDLPRYVRLCQDLAPRAFLGDLSPQRTGGALGDRLATLSPWARQEAVLDQVIAAAADALGLAAPELDIDRGFFDLGLDSVMALDIRTRLEDDFGLELPATLTFEYPTAAQLADYLLGEIAAGPAAGNEPATENANEPIDVLAAEMAAAEQVLISGAGSTHE
ncbi:MAG: hypothetical protein J2P26_08520, partial [Nocardiopsaceae bacterium]|nr:hypothetical protein [Nocardiopsaceae bacterium]